MNYLAHHAVARAAAPDSPPEFYLGNVLPDLLGTSGDGRLRIKPVADEKGTLARGVRLHLATDHRFHGHPAFKEAMADVSARLKSAPFSTPPHRVFFLAHVFVEIALDGLLARENPGHVSDFYAQFAQCDLAAVVEQAGVWLDAPGPLLGLAYTIERFVSAEYLYHYTTGDGQAGSLVRVAERAGVPLANSANDQALLAGIFEDCTTAMSLKKAILLVPPSPALWYNPNDSEELINTSNTVERNDKRAD